MSMTEEGWLASTPDNVMIDRCRALPAPRPLNGRKPRLFAGGCSRLLWPEIRCPLVRRAVEIAEGRADRLVADREIAGHRYPGGGVPIDSLDHRLQVAVQSLMFPQVNPAYVAWEVRSTAGPLRYGPERCSAGCEQQADPLRDVLGNLFRPVEFDSGCRTSTVIALAKQMYDSRDFSPMPIPADALQDTGCGDDHVLAHCRTGRTSAGWPRWPVWRPESSSWTSSSGGSDRVDDDSAVDPAAGAARPRPRPVVGPVHPTQS